MQRQSVDLEHSNQQSQISNYAYEGNRLYSLSCSLTLIARRRRSRGRRRPAKLQTKKNKQPTKRWNEVKSCETMLNAKDSHLYLPFELIVGLRELEEGG